MQMIAKNAHKNYNPRSAIRLIPLIAHPCPLSPCSNANKWGRANLSFLPTLWNECLVLLFARPVQFGFRAFLMSHVPSLSDHLLLPAGVT